MRKSIMIIAILSLSFSLAYAETAPEEETYRDLDKLHQKLVRMKKEMNTLMKDVISTYPEDEKSLSADFGQDVRVDVTENDKNIIVKADLPGMEKDKIDITLEKDRILKIAGTREIEKTEKGPGTVKQERSYGKFERVLELPCEGMAQGIEANYKNGVLELVIPKKAKAKEETVKIKVQ